MEKTNILAFGTLIFKLQQKVLKFNYNCVG